MNTPAQQVLFLCTGNYYRSRFAEIVFNVRAQEIALPWHAVSRGLALERGTHNIGPMSRQAIQALEKQGIQHPETQRFPLAVNDADFHAAHLIIALEESEHRPLLALRFPTWIERVEYWRIYDTDQVPPGEALPALEQEVQRLLARLALPNNPQRSWR